MLSFIAECNGGGGLGVCVSGGDTPLQTRPARLAREPAPESGNAGPIPEIYWKLERLWIVFGAIVTLVQLAAIEVMVGKAG